MRIFRLVFVAVVYSVLSFSLCAQTASDQKKRYDLSAGKFRVTLATPAAPTVTTGNADQVQSTSVRFNGFITPNNAQTFGWFEWGLAPSFSDTTIHQDMGSGSGSIALHQVVAGLVPNTTYQFRAVGENSLGTRNGTTRTVTTLAITPTVSTNEPTSISFTSATLHGTVNPNHASTTAFFEWGTDTLYGNATSVQSLGGDTLPMNISASLTGLPPSTTYHYRTVAQNSAGTSKGNDQTFATLISLNEYLPDANTIALYHFNESSGAFVRDYSGNDLHGIATGAPIVAGKYGNARQYDLSSDVIQVNNTPVLNTGKQSFTLEAWIHPFLVGIGNLTVMSKGNPDSSSFSFALTVLSTGQIDFSVGGVSTGIYDVATAAAPMNDDVWHHVAAVVDFDSMKVKIYHNGIVLSTATSGVFPDSVTSNAPLRFGLPYGSIASPFAPEELFHCRIDEARISNVARQPSEFHILSQIYGIKFHDANANGMQDNGEIGLGNWTIVLSGAMSETTHTDGNGKYLFSNLIEGSYTVQESSQVGWVQTLPPNNGSYSFFLSIGSDTGRLNFGNFAPSIKVRAGWNMLSLPVTVANGRKTILFPMATTSAFSYNGVTYQKADSLENKAGYWLKFSYSQSIPMLGTPRLDDTISLHVGWNMIGSITNPLSVGAVTTTPLGILKSQFFAYRGSYSVTDSIRPGESYWIKSNDTGAIILHSSASIIKAAERTQDDFSQLNSLTIREASGYEQTLYFGIDHGSISLEKYQVPPVPPAETFDVRFTSQRFAELFQPKNVTTHWFMMQAVQYPVTFQWNIRESHESYLLRDNISFKPLLEGSGIAILDHSTSLYFTIELMGSTAPIIPKEFALQQNYPNPFNPVSTIEYALPTAQYVLLKVYNILGEEVRVLVDKMQEAGNQSIIFDATNLPSGVYTYKLTAGSFTQIKTMVLLK